MAGTDRCGSEDVVDVRDGDRTRTGEAYGRAVSHLVDDDVLDLAKTPESIANELAA